MKKSFYYILFALTTLSACQQKKPSMVELRREEIRRNDSTELAQVRTFREDADRDIQRLEMLEEALNGKFVFEKVERFQTQGYWVLPAYQGSKERFTFFPEVEESGKLLLVHIDQQRRYTFTEMNLDSQYYNTELLKGLSKQQLADVEECRALATTMKLLVEARQRQEKMALKVRFYEEKMRRDNESNK